MLYRTKALFATALMLADIVVLSVSRHAGSASEAFVTLGALVVIRLFLFCAMSGLMWNTVLFRFGLIGMLCDKFKWLVASFAISSCLSVAEMTSRGSELGSGGNKAGVSSGGGMQSLSIINTIACLVLYAACFQTMVDLANADLYDTTKWIGSRGASAGR